MNGKIQFGPGGRYWRLAGCCLGVPLHRYDRHGPTGLAVSLALGLPSMMLWTCRKPTQTIGKTQGLGRGKLVPLNRDHITDPRYRMSNGETPAHPVSHRCCAGSVQGQLPNRCFVQSIIAGVRVTASYRPMAGWQDWVSPTPLYRLR